MRKLLCALGVCVAGAVQAAPAYSTLTWSGFTSTTAAGTVSDSRGNISATLSVHHGGASLLNILGSAYFGTFYGGQSAADVYEPNLSGVRDFLSIASQSDATVYTLSFSREVVNPVFHVYDVDFRNYSFQSGVTATVLSGLNLVAAGGVVGDDNGTVSSYDAGRLDDPNRGAPSGSAYGSFQLLGRFTSIQWTRPLVSGGYVSDGNWLGIAITGSVSEPGSLALAGLGLVLAGTAGRRAYRPRLKPTDSTLGLRISSSRGEGRVTLAS